MLLVRTYVGQSEIQGVGVFAAEPIRKGMLIWEYNRYFDLLIPASSLEGAPAHMQEFLERYAYPDPNNPGFLLFEADNGRFMNHSFAPNTRYTDKAGVALADVAIGEELTCDYREIHPGHQLLPHVLEDNSDAMTGSSRDSLKKKTAVL